MPKCLKFSKNNYNRTNLEKYLALCNVPKGNTFTHTSISQNPRSYYIKPNEVDKFHEYYYDHVFVKKRKAYLTEGIKDLEITPIKIDLDFRAWQKCEDGDVPQRLYKMEDIIKICQLYMKVMEDWLITPDPNERECFIMEKDHPGFDKDNNGNIKVNDVGEKRIKDGVHIMFPNITTKTFLQLEFRKYVFKNCEDILDKYNYDNSYANIFDRCVIDRNNWQMYGSRKNTDSLAYKVTQIIEVYQDTFNKVELSKYSNKELVSLLSVRNSNEIPSSIKTEKEFEMEELEHKQQILKRKRKMYSTKGNKKVTRRMPRDDLILIHGYTDKSSSEWVKGYIDCLSVERAQNYDTWIEVGWALHNIDNVTGASKTGHCVLLKDWIKWGRQPGSGYEMEPIDTYEDAWDNMRCSGYGIGSLKIWAKEDALKQHDQDVAAGLKKPSDPTLYEKIVTRDLYNGILKATAGKKGGTSFDVAKVMYQMYKDDFICVSIKDTLWYYYDHNLHRWVLDDKGIHLRMKISNDVWKKFNDFGNRIAADVAEPGDENEIRRDKIYKTTARLKDTSFKNSIMVECTELFYDKTRRFYEELDSNMNLIGFNNGVYNLLTDEFRSGKPEDYISMSTNIDFIRHDPNSREVTEIKKFMSQILINDNVRNYVVKLMASFLSGSTKNEKFHVWSGCGGNGKSKLIELLEMAMGDYAGKMNITALTTKRVGSGDANPELARTKGKRFVNLQEPDEKSKLNVGLMKELTGGDKIIVRALYKEPIEFKPQFKLVLTCNDKPELPANDEGTWRRVMLVQFTSKFTHTPHGHYENPKIKKNWIPDDKINPEFPIDESLNERFNDWTESFMSYLLHVYKTEVKNKTMKEPKEVQEYTKQYRDQNEQFNEFINDRIIYEPGNDCILQFSAIMSEYREWYKANHGVLPGSKRTKDLRIFLDKKFKSCTDGAGNGPVRTGVNGFRGLLLIQNEDAISDSFINDGDNLTENSNNPQQQQQTTHKEKVVQLPLNTSLCV